MQAMRREASPHVKGRISAQQSGSHVPHATRHFVQFTHPTYASINVLQHRHKPLTTHAPCNRDRTQSMSKPMPPDEAVVVVKHERLTSPCSSIENSWVTISVLNNTNINVLCSKMVKLAWEYKQSESSKWTCHIQTWEYKQDHCTSFNINHFHSLKKSNAC